MTRLTVSLDGTLFQEALHQQAVLSVTVLVQETILHPDAVLTDKTVLSAENYVYGSILASYTYDAWGQVHSASGSMAATNPIRYRGYYYDTETSLYYLQSRYYDPHTGRFLNADRYESARQGVLGCNKFAYCLNNPIAFVDDGGSIATLTLVGYGLYFLLACCCTVLVSEAAITLPAPGNPGDIGLGLSRLEIKVKKWIITVATAAVIELALSEQNGDKIIYRSDVPGQDTFVPREGIDDDGLSFLDGRAHGGPLTCR